MEIWVHRNGQYAGRFSESAIREKVADGSLSATDLAWDEAKSAWKPISEFLAAFPSSPSIAASTVAPENKMEPATGTMPPSDAAHPPSPGFGVASTAAPPEERTLREAARATPPPLPTITIPAGGPPPL